MEGLSSLGHHCSLLGMIGSDQRGEFYSQLLEQKSIESLLLKGTLPTAVALSMVTPDGERTMRTFLGASGELKEKDLHADMFKGAKLVHIEGYSLLNDELAQRAMFYAKQQGALVSFDLASFEIVSENKELVNHLLSNYVDIVFGNEDEGCELYQQQPDVAVRMLADRCEVAVISLGAKGSLICKDKKLIQAPAYRVEPVDTTGAGDLFASGFLHGYLNGLSLELCAHFGAVLARAVVQVVGSVIPATFWGSLNTPFRSDVSTVED